MSNGPQGNSLSAVSLALPEAIWFVIANLWTGRQCISSPYEYVGPLNINSFRRLELTELEPDWLRPLYWPNVHSIYNCMKIETLIRYILHKSFSLNIQILGEKCVCVLGEEKEEGKGVWLFYKAKQLQKTPQNSKQNQNVSDVSRTVRPCVCFSKVSVRRPSRVASILHRSHRQPSRIVLFSTLLCL